MKWNNISNHKDLIEIMEKKTPFEILDIPISISNKDEIKKAYKKMVRTYHPDKADPFLKKFNEEMLKIINNAYNAIIKRLD